MNYCLTFFDPEWDYTGLSIKISGTYKQQTSEKETFAFEFDQGTGEFFAIGLLTYNTQQKTFRTKIDAIKMTGGKRTLIIAHVGKNSMTLIDYYYKCKLRRNTDIGITEFPDDFIQLAKIDIMMLTPDRR